MRLLIVNPRPDFPGYQTGEAFAQNGFSACVPIASLALATVAALVPPDWQPILVEEAIALTDLDTPCDVVALTGFVSQRTRCFELADAFRRRGKLVLIGGPHASLCPDDVRSHADIVVTGEIEGIAGKLFSDIKAGRWRDRYDGGRADVSTSPVPRWDLYPMDRALSGALQTSRGCPFDCDFCDVIAYQGRKQRHKTAAQVLAELDMLHSNGCRNVFLCDDNFTVHRARAREILQAIADWNAAKGDAGMTFATQASVDIARDLDLVRLCVEAGVNRLFLGIETDNADSLAGAGKRQNLRQSPLDVMNMLVSSGVSVTMGMIVGFDQDGPGMFNQLFRLAQASPAAAINLGALVAPPGTPLYARLKTEGRLLGEPWQGAGSLGGTNVVPKLMSHADLVAGVERLAHALYDPAAFAHRLENICRLLPREPRTRGKPTTELSTRLFHALSNLGRPHRDLVRAGLSLAKDVPGAWPHIHHALLRYLQVRYVLDQRSPAEPQSGIG